MTLDQAIKEVQQIAGWRSDKISEITAALSYAQTEREKPGLTYPWWLRKQNDTAIVTVVNQPQYNIPSDFIQNTEEAEGNLFMYTIPGQTNSRTVFLNRMAFKDAQTRYYGEWPYIFTNPPGAVEDQSANISMGVPIDFYLGDTFVLLYPVPDAIYNISWRYWAADAAQQLGQENKWLKNAPWVLIGDAAEKICADLGYAQGLATAQSIGAKARDNMFRSVIHREEAGRRRRMGSLL